MKSFLGGKIRLYFGNAQDIIPDAGDVHSVITDPPYNIGYKYHQYKDDMESGEYFTWQSNLLTSIKPKLAPNGNILWLNYPEAAAVMWNILLGHYHPIEWLTWVYSQHTGGSPLRNGTRAWVWFANSDDPFINKEALRGEYKNPTDKRIKERISRGLKPIDYDWWMYQQVKNVSKEKTGHPCQIPIQMVQRLVEATCPIGGTVLDFFTGSGTTAEACVRTGRGFVGAENDPEYFKIAVERIERAISEIS